MPVTNFPNGFASGITIRGLPLLTMYPGQVFWVDSNNGSNGNPGTFSQPFSTIDYAVGKCTANRGDIIFAKPGHVETVSSAGALDLDVAGIAVVGLGTGSARCTIDFTTATTADVDVDAANISLVNILFTGSVDAVVAGLDVNAADFSLVNCEYRDVTGQIVDFLLTDANADRLYVDGFTFQGTMTAGSGSGETNSAIVLVGCDRPVITNSHFIGRFAIACIECRTTAVVMARIYNCHFTNFDNRAAGTGGVAIEDVVTGSTGYVGPNLYIAIASNAANITEAVTGATFFMHSPVMVVNAVNEVSFGMGGASGFGINWAGSTDA